MLYRFLLPTLLKGSKMKNLISLVSKKKNVKAAILTAYVLVVLGFAATARADYNTLPIFTDNKQLVTENFVGAVVTDADGTPFLITEEEVVYRLESNIDLVEFSGKRVQVSGVEVKYKSGPVYDTMSVPMALPVNEDTDSAPVLVVLNIVELQ